MHFIVERDQILNPLTRVNTVVDRNPTIPIIANILLTVDEDKNGFQLTGSNIEIEISEHVRDVEVTESGKVAFLGLTVQEFCRQQPKGCRLKFEFSDGMVNINKLDDATGSESEAAESSDVESRRSHLSLQTMMQDSSVGPFPILDTGNWDISFQISRSDLMTIVQRAQHAMGSQDLRYYLNAMLFEMTDSELRTVATDGHRMAVCHTEVVTGLNESTHRAIVPRKTVLDLSKLLGDFSSPITLQFNENHVRAGTPNITFTSKLLEGTYPDWRGVIPANLSRVFQVTRESITASLRRVVGILGPEVPATMKVEDGTLRLHAQSSRNSQAEIDELLGIEQHGEALLFQVNGKYLLDIFEVMKEYDKVEFNLKNAQSACLLKFPGNESSSFLVMLLKDR
ncbi:MAG: DNA polymerase III subunit beta [Acidiferrobacterales bacterium]|nr:DNA polymerase III subunit beta [Acidiferrobacterales bacterium]